jgi:hypothetical protein
MCTIRVRAIPTLLVPLLIGSGVEFKLVLTEEMMSTAEMRVLASIAQATSSSAFKKARLRAALAA